MKARLATTLGVAAVAATLTAACTQTMTSGRMPAGHMMAAGNGATMDAPSSSKAGTTATSTSPAAGLRTTLNTLLAEHVVIAAGATGAALDGRQAEFKAAAQALDANSVAIAQAIGSVYGQDAE